MRDSEERFRQTFELAGSGMAHVSLDGRFLRVNRSLCRILGYPEAELVGRGVDVSEVFHRPGPGKPPLSGRHPERLSYFSYATFNDPDGNRVELTV